MNSGASMALKTSQCREMGQLVKGVRTPGVPQFCVGDYNTSNLDSSYYRALISNLDAEDGAISGTLTCTNDHVGNDMEEPDMEQDIIDYVSVRPNGVRPLKMTRTIKRYCQRWSPTHQDLSDHYALLMELTW